MKTRRPSVTIAVTLVATFIISILTGAICPQSAMAHQVCHPNSQTGLRECVEVPDGPAKDPTSTTIGGGASGTTKGTHRPPVLGAVIVTCAELCPTYRFFPTCSDINRGGLSAADCKPPLNGCPGQPKLTAYELRETIYPIFLDGVVGRVCRAFPPHDPKPWAIGVLANVHPDLVEATISPFGNVLPKTLPVFLQVTMTPDDKQYADSDGYLQLKATLTDPQYTWYFDDGVELPATGDPGAPYPDGKVTYTFKTIGHHAAFLKVSWTLHYKVWDPELPMLDQQGTIQLEQATRPMFPITIVEAHAVLVG